MRGGYFSRAACGNQKPERGNAEWLKRLRVSSAFSCPRGKDHTRETTCRNRVSSVVATQDGEQTSRDVVTMSPQVADSCIRATRKLGNFRAMYARTFNTATTRAGVQNIVDITSYDNMVREELTMFFYCCVFAFISHLEVSHTLQVLDGQGGFHLLDAMHHGTAYQNVRQQEACDSEAERERQTANQTQSKLVQSDR